ncbi:ABC transporter substrate-binding protein [Gordonia pseudamarae]|jgi:branched-chain amino acid transport system substrate-binding protein|uniref:ABC transporter substrate-binding protein n=1 Tax=Gordonia pseudamarae TaxID=2831662 RepID=A0ABX6IEF0_9ACTN|nr:MULTISPECIES: ABC transporter substrate-binding protein [Gordonia]MBD0021733.1 ABC transporter substrate-binding protein [Gordonia sp. (in: high G+C Gram-positive bacteria)]QHN25295.1 ABC transporter substrate-binding protein [Gordonia pseudamarae]QHN34227.1 ABC transporter substrate-binding protein [Gordonia pseudamarae]
MRTKRMRAVVASAAVAVVATAGLAACGSDDDDSTGSSSASVTAPEGSFPGKAASGAPVKIGLINPEGGPAISMPENRAAAEAATTYANENLGGIGGRPIELVVCKNKEDTASARECANQMVEAKVSAVVVTATSMSTVMAPIITKAGIPYTAVAGAGSEIMSDNAFIWSGASGAYQYMAKFSAQENLKSVTAYAIDVPASLTGLQMVATPAFKAAGIDFKIVRIPAGTPEVTPQVSAGLTDKTDGVIVIGNTAMCTAVFKSLGTLGADVKKMTPQSCADAQVYKSVGDSLNGTQVFTTADTRSDDPESQLYRAVMDKYTPETDAHGYAVSGYQGVLGLVRATESLDGSDTSPAAVITAITTAKDVKLPAAHGLTFTCDGTAQPQFKAVCGKGMIVVNLEQGIATDLQVVQ